MRSYSLSFMLAIVIELFLNGCVADNHEKNRIQPYRANRSFWQYEGKPLFLLGANQEDNTFQIDHPESYIEALNASGGNYFRNVMSDRDQGNLKAFKLSENGKYDLNRWNDEFWHKFRNMLELASRKDIIVHITLWDRFDHYDQGEDAWLWRESPWNPVNNINYTRSETGLDSTYTGHPATGKNPFFKTPPTMEDNPEVLHFQQKYIERIMDISLKFNNVLYNIGNEHQSSLQEWDHYWCRYIRAYAKHQGRKIETTAMFDRQEFAPVIKKNDHYTFVEGSKIGSQWTGAGEVQYNDAISLINRTSEIEVRPVNAVKVRTQRIVYNAQERLWRPLMAGFAALSHHRHTAGFTSGEGSGKAFNENEDDEKGWPVGGLGFTEMARTNLKSMRIFTDMMIPWECMPRQDLLSAREEDEAYLLAKEGERYGLYFTKGDGSVGLDLQEHEETFKVQWIDIGMGQIVKESAIEGGDIVSIKTPYEVEYGWACVLTAS